MGNVERIRKRYREGQEDQLGALGLVVNAVVLRNTLYMDRALGQLREKGFNVKPEDVARLSPLQFEHVNFLGTYHFDQKGSFDPLEQTLSTSSAGCTAVFVPILRRPQFQRYDQKGHWAEHRNRYPKTVVGASRRQLRQLRRGFWGWFGL